jgi:hypothetical protein
MKTAWQGKSVKEKRRFAVKRQCQQKSFIVSFERTFQVI